MGGNRGIRKIQGGLRQLLAAVAQLFMYLLKSAQPYAVIGLEGLTKGWNRWSSAHLRIDSTKYKNFRGPWPDSNAAQKGRTAAAACIKSHGRL